MRCYESGCRALSGSPFRVRDGYSFPVSRIAPRPRPGRDSWVPLHNSVNRRSGGIRSESGASPDRLRAISRSATICCWKGIRTAGAPAGFWNRAGQRRPSRCDDALKRTRGRRNDGGGLYNRCNWSQGPAKLGAVSVTFLICHSMQAIVRKK